MIVGAAASTVAVVLIEASIAVAAVWIGGKIFSLKTTIISMPALRWVPTVKALESSEAWALTRLVRK